MEQQSTETPKTNRPRRIAVATAVFGLCLALGAVLTMRFTSRKVTKELGEITPFLLTQQAPTSAAQNPLNEIPDPRAVTEPTETPTAKPKPAPATEAQTTAPPTTAAATQKTEQAAKTIRNESFVLPLEKTDVLKGYSPKRPVFSATMGDWRTHAGIDFSAQEGAPVRAVGNGVVTAVSADVRWGYVIEIDHGSFTARYCSLSQENAVRRGDTVTAGAVIGTLETPPLERADAPHLHFETLRDGKQIPPLEALELG